MQIQDEMRNQKSTFRAKYLAVLSDVDYLMGTLKIRVASVASQAEDQNMLNSGLLGEAFLELQSIKKFNAELIAHTNDVQNALHHDGLQADLTRV